MQFSEYGPFANVVAIACAITATFSVFLLKMLGKMTRWSWLTKDSPSFLVTAGARMLVVALMAATYVTINGSNYRLYLIPAIGFGVLGFVTVIRFDYLRKLYILAVPLLAKDGQQLQDAKGCRMFKNEVIGSEDQLKKSAKMDYKAAQKKTPGLSLPLFMSGYGNINNPEDLWDRTLLVKKSNTLTIMLMGIVLSAVMVLFLAALVIEAANRPT